MPSPKTTSSQDRLRGGLREKSVSFHGRGSMKSGQLLRPKTVPDLRSGGGLSHPATSEGRPKLTKLLLNVTIQGSLGPVQVLMSPENNVGELVTAAVRLYVKEGRRPVLLTPDPAAYDLHYSQFSLESLDKEEKLEELGSRNFFLCKRTNSGVTATTSSPASCSKQAEKARKTAFGAPLMRLMGFMQ